MSPNSSALLALIAVTGLLLSHRTIASMKNPFTVAGTALSVVGFSALLIFWSEVEFTVFAEGSTVNCASALGMTGDISALRERIRVVDNYNPPSVDCQAGDKHQTLTPVSTTKSLRRDWTAGWVALCLGPTALAVGLMRSRGWRTARTQ
jgi:hypothetical protein